MSLEKEPAGAFNKAQRLIECCQDIDELRVLQGAGATQFDRRRFPINACRRNPARAAFAAACKAN
jgi:hypothetical protein